MIELTTNENRSRKAVFATIKYGVALILAGLILPGIIYAFYASQLVSTLCEFLIFPLAVAYAGRMLEIAGLRSLGNFTKIIVAPFVYTFLFFSILLNAIAVSINRPDLIYFAFPTSILLLSGYVLYFGTTLFDIQVNARMGYIGLYSIKVSKYVFILAVGLFIGNIRTVYVFLPAFILASVTGFVVNARILFPERRGSILSGLSEYLSYSGGRWVALMGLLGFFYGLFLIPKQAIYNEVLFIVFFISVSLAVILVAIKIYMATSNYVESLVATTYKKHEYNSDLVTNRELDYLSHATREFISRGDSMPLVISLSTLLARRDLQFKELDTILYPLSTYSTPNTDFMFRSGLRRILENRMRERHEIVQSVMKRISNLEENEPWKKEKKTA